MLDSSKNSTPSTSVSMTLNLSAEQSQVLADLGIDAWYLHSLSRSDSDPAYQQQQTEIAGIVDSLSLVVDTPSQMTTPVAKPVEVESVASTNKPLPENTVQTVISATTNTLTGQSSQLLTKTEVSQTVSPLSLAPIQLSTTTDLTPPSSGIIDFPSKYMGDIEPTAKAITAAITVLPQYTQGTDDNPVLPDDLNHTLTGIGSQVADWMIVSPPPMYRHLREKTLLLDSEQQLLTESLSAIGKSFDEVYITPLLKQGVYKQKDPNHALLAIHLPILAAEIIQIRPKRLILLGHTPPQALLSTKAPLSQLMDGDYQLRLSDTNIPISIMPSLHYFLAMPAEKSLLWRCLKRFSA